MKEQNHVQIIKYKSAEECLENLKALYATCEILCIITDYDMGSGKNGAELRCEIEEIDKRIPVILNSGEIREEASCFHGVFNKNNPAKSIQTYKNFLGFEPK